MLAAILETSDPQRLYTGLSLLVCAASDGEEVRMLLGFAALPALDSVDGDEPFERTLHELWVAAQELCRVQMCAATGIREPFEVVSMPQFVREVADARLVFV